jgi:hypothetical protein
MSEEVTGEPPENKQADKTPKFKYDIAVSFAGGQREWRVPTE